MPHVSEFLASFQTTLSAPTVPERILARYELVSVLGHGEEGGAFLLRRRSDGAPFVLKINAGGQDLAEEFHLLGRLRKGLAPEPVDYFEEEGVQYLIRTYIPGHSLAEAWDAGASFHRWTELGIDLCGLLEELHGMTPPIVHRDIKPENIILTPEGTPRLIDFGIARSYKPDQETDTVLLGSRTTAAPEQYGFAQTGPRTDLYALGVTLRWMVTGSYQPEALERADCPVRVKRFLRKAAAFDPEDRFPTASAMANALRRLPYRWTRDLKARAASFFLGVAAALLTIAVMAGIPRLQETARIDFGSPLLEAAVRAELDKPEGEITREDLANVRRLAVVGQQLLSEEQEFQCDAFFHIDGVDLRDAPRGDISDLSLLAEMPNLTTLYMCFQEISDLTPLEGLPIQELSLVDNNIRDLTPLEHLPELRILQLNRNPAEDLAPLSSLKHLRRLNLGETAPQSLSPLRELPLEYLCMYHVEPRDGDWSVLPTLGKLDYLWMDGSSPASIAVLPECRRVTNMVLWGYEAEDLQSLPVMPQLGALSFGVPFSSCEGVQRQKNLGYFGINYRGEIDLTPITELKNLSQLNLDGDILLDYHPLLECGSLRWVGVHKEEIAAAIEADCPGHAFEIVLE